MTYIKPPASHKCTWRSGPPPEVGWWPAGCTLDPSVLRWWDGEYWSWHAHDHELPTFAGFRAESKTISHHIQWTDRWWLK